jgi:putative tryptophan/tyrosine transport system substrate-binding protein
LFSGAALGAATALLFGCSRQIAPRTFRVGFFTLPDAGPKAAGEKLLQELRLALHASAMPVVQVVASRADLLQFDPRAEPLDVAVAANSEIALQMRRIAPTLPLVFAAGNDPIESGLVESYARPNRGATGFTYDIPIHGRRFELLKDCVTHLRRVGVVVDNWYLENPREYKTIADTARLLGIEVIIAEAEDVARLKTQLVTLKSKGVSAVCFPMSTAIERHEAHAAALCRELGLPAIYPYAHCVKEGGLISYEAKVDNPYAILARQCALIFAGTPAGEIPVVTPQRFRFAVNLDAARAIGLKLPSSVLLRADEYVGGNTG